MRHFVPPVPTWSTGRRVAALVVAILALGAVVAAADTGIFNRSKDSSPGAQSAHSTAWTPSYGHDVQPILDRNCIRCHGPVQADKGLRLDSYQRTMAGDSYGTVVIPGQSSLSAMLTVIKYGTMPHDAQRLTPEEIETLALWIDVGAPQN